MNNLLETKTDNELIEIFDDYCNFKNQDYCSGFDFFNELVNEYAISLGNTTLFEVQNLASKELTFEMSKRFRKEKAKQTFNSMQNTVKWYNVKVSDANYDKIFLDVNLPNGSIELKDNNVIIYKRENDCALQSFVGMFPNTCLFWCNEINYDL